MLKITEKFKIRNGWLIPFKEEPDYIYKLYNQLHKKEDSNEFNYLREHNDGC
jgi:hypothetical protein